LSDGLEYKPPGGNDDSLFYSSDENDLNANWTRLHVSSSTRIQRKHVMGVVKRR
jgi:hypothetical protein